MRRDYAAAEATTQEALALCKEYEFGFYEIMNRTYRGIAFALQHKLEQSRENARQTPAVVESDSVLSRTYIYSALAESLVNRGKLENARHLLEQAAAFLAHNQERYVEAEIERVRGQVVLKQSELGGLEKEEAWATAETFFRNAMAIAERAGSKMLQLRAVMALARLLVVRGEIGPARQLAEDGFAWFSEGFDVPDLVEARAFLDDLRRQSPATVANQH
jgi:predicted ATPase